MAAVTPPPGPVVVELFTSQGCSSCPPADALLGELASSTNVIALAFHVDYWNGIGWRDRYSLPEATERQHRYVEALHLSTAFTPQIVIDGRRSLVGSDRQRVTAALSETPSVLAIDAAVAGEQLVVSLPNIQARHRFDINVIAYLPRSTTTISGGENAGRTLTESNLVRQIQRLGPWEGTAHTFTVPLSSFPGDSTQVVILVQQAHEGPIAGAALVSLNRGAQTR